MDGLVLDYFLVGDWSKIRCPRLVVEVYRHKVYRAIARSRSDLRP